MFQQDVTVVRRDGQWRISSLPPGVVVPLSVFRDNYKPVRAWFIDPVRRLAVADVRHVPTVPARAQAARVMELLLAGPSGALTGASTVRATAVNPAAAARSIMSRVTPSSVNQYSWYQGLSASGPTSSIE